MTKAPSISAEKMMVIIAPDRSKLKGKGAEELDVVPTLLSAIASAIQGSMVNKTPINVWCRVQGACSGADCGCTCFLSGVDSIKGLSSIASFYEMYVFFHFRGRSGSLISYHRCVEK